MSIKSIMSKSVISVEIDSSLKEVKELFDRNNFHHLLVVNKKCLVGVISDRDLLSILSPFVGTAVETERDTATLEFIAQDIMSTQMQTLTIDADIYDAVDLFNVNKISCIPVVNNENHPVGIVSWRDIMKALAIVHKSK